MIEQLEQLCLAAGVVSDDATEQIVDAVNRRLKDLTKAQIVKLYWRAEAERGILLRPVAYINESGAPDPQSFHMDDESKGVLEWTFRAREPLWLDNLRAQSAEGGAKSTQNQATHKDIPWSDLRLSEPPQSDAMVVVPISERGMVQGLYSLEWQSTPTLAPTLLAFMRRLSNTLSPLLFNADMYDYDLKKTKRAISTFLTSIRDYKFDPVLIDQQVRTAFVARPFGNEWNPVQKGIARALAAHGVRAQDYRAQGHHYIVDEITRQIRNAHFCIADITSNNPNVLQEVGMMQVLRKRVIVMKRRGDDLDAPFNLQHFNIWYYDAERDTDELFVSTPADAGMFPFTQVLDDFINDLPADTGFFDAESFTPDTS